MNTHTPTILIGGLFNYDTQIVKTFKGDPGKVICHEVGGTAGCISKLTAAMGWHTLPIGRFDETVEGRALAQGLVDAGCDNRFVTNTSDGGTTLLSIITTRIEGAPLKKSIRASNALDKANGIDSRFPRWKFPTLKRAKEIVESLSTAIPDVFFFDYPCPGHLELARSLKERGTLIVFEPYQAKDKNNMRGIAVADVVKFSNEDFPGDPTFVNEHCEKLFIQTLGGPAGLRFRFPHADEWTLVAGFVNDNIVNPEGCGDWTTSGFLTTLARTGILTLAEMTSERVFEALSVAQWYASRNVSYVDIASKELLEETGVRGIIDRPYAGTAIETHR